VLIVPLSVAPVAAVAALVVAAAVAVTNPAVATAVVVATAAVREATVASRAAATRAVVATSPVVTHRAARVVTRAVDIRVAEARVSSNLAQFHFVCHTNKCSGYSGGGSYGQQDQQGGGRW
jgi:hypothetical protein